MCFNTSRFFQNLLILKYYNFFTNACNNCRNFILFNTCSTSFFSQQVLHNIGSIDFRGIVCDQDRLREYMMFRLGVNVTSVSTSLCGIPESKIPEITNVVQNQIDIAAIIRVVCTAKYMLLRNEIPFRRTQIRFFLCKPKISLSNQCVCKQQITRCPHLYKNKIYSQIDHKNYLENLIHFLVALTSYFVFLSVENADYFDHGLHFD